MKTKTSSMSGRDRRPQAMVERINDLNGEPKELPWKEDLKEYQMEHFKPDYSGAKPLPKTVIQKQKVRIFHRVKK